MITLQQWMETVSYRITEGSRFDWQCYGDSAHTLSSWNGSQTGHSLSVTFDTKTQTVYEVTACDYANQRAYRIINPDYRQAYQDEAEENDALFDQAWDDVDYIDLETDDDWLSKAQAIVANADYDTRVSIPVDFTDEELLRYMTMAHERDMTFNEFVEEALRHAIDEFHRDPDGFKIRTQKFIDSSAM